MRADPAGNDRKGKPPGLAANRSTGNTPTMDDVIMMS
jgi:hypothetical protein